MIKAINFALIAFVIAIGSSFEFAAADTVLGRWCDRMVPSIDKLNAELKIVVTDSGETQLHSKFGDGSSGVSKLREKGAGIFEQVGSSSGDKYRVVPTTGELQLLDNDGYIRSAKRLENSPQKGDCLR